MEMSGCLCCHSDPTPGVASSERPLAHPLSHSLAERPVVLFQALFTSDTFICLFISYPTSHAATAKSLQSCPTLCDPMAAHQAPVPGILQARILEWVAIDIPTPVHKQQIAPSTCNPWNVYNTPGNWPLC